MNQSHCPRCEFQLPPGSNFCSVCTLTLTVKSPTITGGEWRPSPTEFAARILPQDLHSIMASKGLNIDESQTGLLLENGRFVHELTAGRHTLQSLGDRIRGLVTGRTAVAILIRKGIFPLTLKGALLTPEAHKVTWDLEFGLQLADRNTFYVHFMQSSAVITAAEILDRIGPAAREAILSVCQSCSSTELNGLHPELRERLKSEITDALSSVCGRLGLSVNYVNAPVFRNEQLVVSQKERATYINDLRERRLKQEYEKKRSEIEAREYLAKQIVLEAKFAQLTEEAERTAEYSEREAAVLQNVELHGMKLREQLDAIKDDIAARKRDHRHQDQMDANVQQHKLATIELQTETELATLRFSLRRMLLDQEHELDEKERQARLQAAEEELAAELRRIDLSDRAKLTGWQHKKHVESEVTVLDAETQASVRKIAGETDLAIRKSNHDQIVMEEKAKADLRLSELKGLSALQQERLQQQQELQSRIQADGLTVKRAEHDLSEASKRAKREHDLQRLQLMKDMPEAFQLMETAKTARDNPAMSAMLASALKLAIAKGLTPEQLEVVTAGESPEFARTLQEKFRAQTVAAQDQIQLQKDCLERVITELKSSQQLTQQQTTDFLSRLERVGINGQELLRDVGVAAGSRGDQKTDSTTANHMKELISHMDDMKKKLDDHGTEKKA